MANCRPNTRIIYALLSDEPITTGRLAEISGVHLNGVRSSLGVLTRCNCARKIGMDGLQGIWMKGPGDVTRLSDPSGLWTDERIEALRELVLSGLSADAIARKLGGGLTNNAVIGKCTRMGLKLQWGRLRKKAESKREPRPAKPKVARAPKPPKTEKRAVAFGQLSLSPSKPVKVETQAANAECKPLVDLKRNECRGPYDAPAGHRETFLFCAALIDPDNWPGCYCAHHRRVMRGVGTESERSAHRVLERAA